MIIEPDDPFLVPLSNNGLRQPNVMLGNCEGPSLERR
jgi:hypothetical protein